MNIEEEPDHGEWRKYGGETLGERKYGRTLSVSKRKNSFTLISPHPTGFRGEMVKFT